MKRIAMSVVALACMCCFVSTVNAGGECCKSKAKGTTVAASEAKSGCCKGGSDGFPTMKIMVGDKSMECPMEAEKVAKESKAKVIYVVDGEKYECKQEAGEALANAAEVFADHYVSVACVVNGNPIYCDSMSKGGCSDKGATKVAAKSEGSGCCKAGEKAKTGQSETTKVAASGAEGHGKGEGCTGKGETTKVAAKTEKSEEGCCMSKAGAKVKYMVLGKTFDKMSDAEKARDEIMPAVKKVSMKTMIDGKEVACDEVCPDAEKAGKVTYMVNGEKVQCKIKARVLTAKAKYEAAKSAMDKKMAKA